VGGVLAEAEVVSGRTDGSTVVQIPDVATALAFRTTASGRSDLFVVGPRTRGRYHAGRGVPVCVRLRLQPGVARAVFGVPVRALVDRTVRVTDLWGASGARLTASLVAAGPDTARVLALLQEAVLARAGASSASSADLRVSPAVGGFAPVDGGLLAAAIRSLSAEPGRLADVAAGLGVSERHLRNLFAREIGLSPKHFARITRLRRVLDQAGTRRWSAVAGDAGFFDQAHMISDFRALMGVPPAAYLNGRTPGPTPCVPLSAAST
jgi:AraC-like DNA-binding protein